MRHYSSLLAGIITLLLFFSYFQAMPQKKPSDPTVKEIDKVLDEIKKLKKDGMDNDDDKIKELAKKAIHMADTAYGISKKNWEAEPEYDPDEEDYAGTVPSKKDKKKGKVDIGPEAFTTPGWLAATKYHESIHCNQIAAGKWPCTDPEKVNKTRNMMEIEAYDEQVKKAKEIFGLTDEQIKELLGNREDYYDDLDDDNQEKADKKDYTVAFLGPTEKSMEVLVSKAEVFVTGSVMSDERMAVTVRGQNNVSGMVVQTQIDGKTTSTRTNKMGKAIIDFSTLAVAATGTAVAIVKILDSKGRIVDQKNTIVSHGTPMIQNRPVCETLPHNIQTNSVVTIPGHNIGADANLVLGNQVQETLSASDREMNIFIDSKTGTQPAYIITPNGVSKGQTVNVYSMNFTISKTTISAGEHITGQVQYEGLPIGSEVIFTNNSPGVISIAVQNSATASGKTIFRIGQSSGVIPINITGISRGAFSISADPSFH